MQEKEIGIPFIFESSYLIDDNAMRLITVTLDVEWKMYGAKIDFKKVFGENFELFLFDMNMNLLHHWQKRVSKEGVNIIENPQQPLLKKGSKTKSIKKIKKILLKIKIKSLFFGI